MPCDFHYPVRKHLNYLNIDIAKGSADNAHVCLAVAMLCSLKAQHLSVILVDSM